MEKYLINTTELCADLTLTFWNPQTTDFGLCFSILALLLPTHVIFAIVAAFQLGLAKPSGQIVQRTRGQKASIIIRCILSLLLALCFIVSFSTIIYEDRFSEAGYVAILEVVIVTLSWIINCVYNFMLLGRCQSSYRGSKYVILTYCLCLVTDFINSRSEIILHPPDSEGSINDIIFGTFITVIICHSFYLMTFVLPSRRPDQAYVIFPENEEELRTRRSSLGIAKQSTSMLSRLFLHWVNPLINKGRRGQLETPDDGFDLPHGLDTTDLSNRFQIAKSDLTISRQIPIFRIFYKLFGKQFLFIGGLKFISDCAGFASPLLLNLLISFMESDEKQMILGYVYASGLAVASFIVALSNTHFNLKMSELGLKVRASVISGIYQHTISLPTIEMSKFDVGEIINFMSTDTDRIVNFCPSFHSAWSLPFQFLITLILLYQQLGVASLVGVALTILMIPLNKIIADAIGRMSTKMMKAKDHRVGVMAEILRGIRVIKYFTWENYFESRIWNHRKEELKYLKGRKYLDAICVYLWATTPVLISVLTFTVYVLLGNELSAAKVFTSVALFAMLTGPLNAFPWVLNGLVEAMVSIRRISRYLSIPSPIRGSLFSSFNAQDNDEQLDLLIEHGKFSPSPVFNSEIQFEINNLNLKVKQGEFLGIIGKVGSGKSLLLQIILGEMRKISGKISVMNPAHGIAYVQQEPWLQQKSLRDNITFGKNFDPVWYEKVVDACELKEDFSQLSNGDQTNVGEQGVMLSGGQKARVALARAVYQDKSIYLIDDVFSAVDQHVAKQIYHKCMLQLLKNKTRILCTHHNRFLEEADKIIVMDEGSIIKEGKPSQILEAFSFKPKPNNIVTQTSKESLPKFDEPSDEVETLEQEEQERGTVKWDIYKNYWISVGIWLSPSILISLFLMQLTRNLTDIWLADWISAINDSNKTNDYEADINVKYYLIIYGSLAVSNSVFSFIRAFLFAYGGICAAKTIHKNILGSIFNTKLYFFDSTPLGRILNRFSSDLNTVDDSLPFILNIFLANFVGIIGPILVCAYSVPWVILILIPLTLIYLDIQKKYRPASRDLKRISSVSLSPIYAHFSETLNGLVTIRAMRETNRFKDENEHHIEINQKAQYSSIAAAQWLDMRLQLIGCGVVAGIAVIAVLEHHFSAIDPGYVGLAISYALGITGKLSGLVSSFTETEKQLVAVERCYQYIDDVPQDEDNEDENQPITDWPSSGSISFNNVSLRYRDHLPLALKNLSFDVKDNEKIGIVGRTGSGKSSIFQCLFRTVDIDPEGDILIDSISIFSIPKKILRSQLAIIPQDPLLFSGTVRENLDPLSLRDDSDIWLALKNCHLVPQIERLGGLEGLISDGGKNLSVGQRQLFCLARAMISNAKIICIDEATANVDSETDKLIQKVLQTSLEDRTVLTIAHRIETVMSCNRLIYMSDGEILELGDPIEELSQNPKSYFSQLMHS